MKPGHVHVEVSDLEGTIAFFAKVLSMAPVYKNQTMATFSFGGTSIIVDKGTENTKMTIAFNSSDCDGDFARLVGAGAIAINEPTTQPWGPIRSAYLRGPGNLTIELEQSMSKPDI